ncbi:MAG TPA: hypothetical protein VD886_08985, partial [Herpetosiphonaceae bacterium]|nr:hypothetical protein [Herpetosiphonaceae bacterium]
MSNPDLTIRPLLRSVGNPHGVTFDVRPVASDSGVATVQPRIQNLGTINPTAIAERPSTSNQIILSTKITLPNPLPGNCTFYLSARPDELVPAMVDNTVRFSLGTTKIFEYAYDGPSRPQPRLVAIPRNTFAQAAGKTITVEFVDTGVMLSATPMYLVAVSHAVPNPTLSANRTKIVKLGTISASAKAATK